MEYPDKLLKSAVTLRGDHYYCPLSLQVDAYWNCLVGCASCYLRRMNRTWGEDLRPADITMLRKTLENGLLGKSNTPLGRALATKKTIRFGNKADPYQPIDIKHQVSRKILEIFRELDWSYVVQTKFVSNTFRDLDLMTPKLTTIMMELSPGSDWDWEHLEGKKTEMPGSRLQACSRFVDLGYNVGANGEPYVVGYHTPEMFRRTLKALKVVGINSYNTYFIHLNDYNLKAMHEAGLDIQKIWIGAQDMNWAPIHQELIDIAKDEGVSLGCPDFVNSGRYMCTANTCCGINVPNPSTFTIINWKKLWLNGIKDPQTIIDMTWDGVGDKQEALDILTGKRTDLFTLKDLENHLNGH